MNEHLVVHGPSCQVPVHRASMIHWWEQVTFIHWRFDPVVVQRLLPSGLTVETFDGSAWVGLVPFYMRVALPKSRSVPWLSRFAETNVRTYVKGTDGTNGVWFFSLDAARLGARIGDGEVRARAAAQMPQCWQTRFRRRLSQTNASSSAIPSSRRLNGRD